MQYGTIHAHRAADRSAWRHRLNYLPGAAIALLAVYGMASHHVLVVVLILIAGVTFGYRLQHAADWEKGGSSWGAPRVDGGSFSGDRGAAAAARSGRPTVLDGGTDRSTSEGPVQSGYATAG